MAAGVLMTAHQLGIDVPGELSIAGFDDTYIARTVWPPLTTVHQPIYDLAYTATNLLLQMLETGEAPTPARLNYQLICRDSTAPPPSVARKRPKSADSLLLKSK
jgi:LacI family transcriptional regulator